MMRRFSVPVFVAAVVLGAAPSPSFALGAREVRPRFDDHYRCMYRCEERAESFRPTHAPWPRSPGDHTRPWPPRPRPRPCWLFCGPGGWRPPIWSAPQQWCGPGPFYLDDDWYRHRPCRPHGGHHDDRYDRYRDRDRDHDDRGYGASRHHPRDGDF